jgi:cell division protein FtsB
MAAVPGTPRTGAPRIGAQRTGAQRTGGARPARPAVQPQITAGANGSPTGSAPPRATARALPGGWGVARRRLSRTMIVALAMLAIATAGIVQVLQSSRVAEVGYQLRALEGERESLTAQIRLLEARLASSSNLEVIREQAEGRLGMVPAAEQFAITVEVPAPHVVPLPRRYVELPPREAPPERSWWEELLGALPGLD